MFLDEHIDEIELAEYCRIPNQQSSGTIRRIELHLSDCAQCTIRMLAKVHAFDPVGA